MLEYLMVLGHQQVQCSLQNVTYFFMLWSSIGYHQATTTVMLCSIGTQCKLNKINHKWMELNSVEAKAKWPPFFRIQFPTHFVNENVWILIKISLKFVPKGQINNIVALVQIMALRWPGDKPLSEPIMVMLLMHIGVTRPQWVKTRLWKDIYIYIYCPTRTSKFKSLITLDKKSPGAARFPIRQPEIYYCFYSYMAWYATNKTRGQ